MPKLTWTVRACRGDGQVLDDAVGYTLLKFRWIGEMDLSFVMHALRRAWWVVATGVFLGALLGVALPSLSAEQFESKGSLVISPPERSNVPVTSNLDRYIAGQIAVLTSDSFLDGVAAILADGTTPAQLVAAVVIAQVPDTDIATVTSSAPTSDQAT